VPQTLTASQELTADGSRAGGSLPRPRSRQAERTRAERVAGGKAARGVVPRSSMGAWDRPEGRPDPVELLLAQAEGRLPELVPIRNGRMAASPFSFYRGSAAVMASDLAATRSSGITVQLCGDAHVSNFGGYASPDRTLVFDINDFDETLPGPWEWDVKRLVASLAIAGREIGLDRSERERIVASAATAYRRAMREFAEMGTMQVWYSRLTAGGILERWRQAVSEPQVRAFERRVTKAMGRDSVSAATKFTQLVGQERRMISSPPLIVPVGDMPETQERLSVERFVQAGLRSYGRSLSGNHRHLLEQFRYVGMARKVVGVGSVGTRSWIVLLCSVGGGDDPLMLQLKEARESVLSRYVGKSRFSNQGQRVVEGQQLMQASSDILLGWHRGKAVDGTMRDYYVRQLWDWKVSSDVTQANADTLSVVGQMCGWTLARAHARSGDRLALAAYLGGGRAFERAMSAFAEAYADQNERDYEQFTAAADAGRIDVAADV
jgi:uncharacterized protein (DUF2252 family)